LTQITKSVILVKEIIVKKDVFILVNQNIKQIFNTHYGDIK